jgi:hypothetical protein
MGPRHSMTRVPPVIPACPCPPCRAFDAALDTHTLAIAEGRDAEPSRRAVHDAAVAVDRVHGLDRPIRRPETTPPRDPEPEEDGIFQTAGERHAAAMDAVARRVGFDR